MVFKSKVCYHGWIMFPFDSNLIYQTVKYSFYSILLWLRLFYYVSGAQSNKLCNFTVWGPTYLLVEWKGLQCTRSGILKWRWTMLSRRRTWCLIFALAGPTQLGKYFPLFDILKLYFTTTLSNWVPTWWKLTMST